VNTTFVSECGLYQDITATTTVLTGPGRLLGIFVASASATPTIKIWDSTSAAGTVVVNTFTPSAGTFYPIPAQVATGITVQISGTVDCTPFWAV